MGASHGEFTKYPRTPHLFGSKGTADDKHLAEAESNAFIADESLIVEENAYFKCDVCSAQLPREWNFT